MSTLCKSHGIELTRCGICRPLECPRVLSSNLLDPQRGFAVEIVPTCDIDESLNEIVSARPAMPCFAEPITVTFGVRGEIAPPREGTPYVTLVRGFIDWNVGGAEFKVALDLLQGVQISVNAEALYVRAGARDVLPRWPSPDPSGDWLLPCTKYHVNAALGYGMCSRLAQLTEVAFLQAPGETPEDPFVSERFMIPYFARRVTVQPIGTGIVRLELYGSGRQTVTYIYTSGNAPDEFGIGQQVPIPAGVDFARVTNMGGASVAAYVVFGLEV